MDEKTEFGIAVSGGPDSLALLLLAHARFPGRIAAATFDHGFRAESAAEAAYVAEVCGRLDIPHAALGRGCRISAAEWAETERHERGGQQALARTWRYSALDRWCRKTRRTWLLTGHHADDQAETILLRLARGSGLRGLSGIRPALTATHAFAEGGGSDMAIGVTMVGRPLLGFAKSELAAIVADAGLCAVDDPSNGDMRYDRTQARTMLAAATWIDPRRLAGVADVMRDSEEALAWAARQAWRTNVRYGEEDDRFVDPRGLPEAILRRLCETVIFDVDDIATAGQDARFTGPELTRFIERLRAGKTATLSRIMARPGETWHFLAAPPRRDGAQSKSRGVASVRVDMPSAPPPIAPPRRSS